MKSNMGGKHGGQAGPPKSPPRPKTSQRDADVVTKQQTDQTDRKLWPTNKR
ncbi:hypothetical protein [Bradyrhizobium iriomotense]|uniref:hypothetical protein n=1 Tax=Bradyrhizobium iriomotense TaxID=441950 RepID=UPI0024E13010|nr:hypothetical protein [Bradyrhizobium iriomotense]